MSQYDEEQQPEGFVLQGGVVETKEARENKLAEIRRKLSGAGGAGGLKAPSSAVASSMASAKLAFDLNTESSVATEYYTQEEMIAFRKPRKVCISLAINIQERSCIHSIDRSID